MVDEGNVNGPGVSGTGTATPDAGVQPNVGAGTQGTQGQKPEVPWQNRVAEIERKRQKDRTELSQQLADVQSKLEQLTSGFSPKKQETNYESDWAKAEQVINTPGVSQIDFAQAVRVQAAIIARREREEASRQWRDESTENEIRNQYKDKTGAFEKEYKETLSAFPNATAEQKRRVAELVYAKLNVSSGVDREAVMRGGAFSMGAGGGSDDSANNYGVDDEGALEYANELEKSGTMSREKYLKAFAKESKRVKAKGF